MYGSAKSIFTYTHIKHTHVLEAAWALSTPCIRVYTHPRIPILCVTLCARDWVANFTIGSHSSRTSSRFYAPATDEAAQEGNSHYRKMMKAVRTEHHTLTQTRGITHSHTTHINGNTLRKLAALQLLNVQRQCCRKSSDTPPNHPLKIKRKQRPLEHCKDGATDAQTQPDARKCRQSDLQSYNRGDRTDIISALFVCARGREWQFSCVFFFGVCC